MHVARRWALACHFQVHAVNPKSTTRSSAAVYFVLLAYYKIHCFILITLNLHPLVCACTGKHATYACVGARVHCQLHLLVHAVLLPVLLVLLVLERWGA